MLVTQLGCDTHHSDPLAHLQLTTNAYRETAKRLHGLAHEAAGGRWVATGGGGYQWARVVPRAWTIYFAEMAERGDPRRDPRVVDGARGVHAAGRDTRHLVGGSGSVTAYPLPASASTMSDMSQPRN